MKKTFLIRCEYPDGDHIPTQEFVENIQEYFAANIMDGERGRLVVKPVYQPKEEGLVEEETKFGTASNPIEPKSNANSITQSKVDVIETAKTYWDSIKDAWICPEGYIFKDENGNVINAMKIVLEKKRKEYPKTYEECCEVLDIIDNRPIWHGYRSVQLKIFQKLLIARDAYWKIAGDEMGLGKSWEPDWTTVDVKHSLVNVGNTIIPSTECKVGRILVFPTAKMRDAFYENFKEEIEQCKELL